MLEEQSYILVITYIAYKPRKDLNIYKSHELESTFIKIIKSKKLNKVLGVLYRHPTIDANEFNNKHVNELLDNIAKENKTISLLGNFNIDLLKYDSHTPTNEFLDSFILQYDFTLYLTRN